MKKLAIPYHAILWPLALIFIYAFLMVCCFGYRADAQTMIDTASNAPVNNAQLPSTINQPTIQVSGVAVNASSTLEANVGKALIFNGMLYRNSNNVGIGVAVPVNKLEVVGDIVIGTAADVNRIIGRLGAYSSGVRTLTFRAGSTSDNVSTTGGAYITLTNALNGGGAYGEIIYDTNSGGGGLGDHRFKIAGTDKVIIKESGKVGIGITTPGASAGELLEVKSADPAAFVPNTMTTWSVLGLGGSTATAGDAIGLRFITSTASSHAAPGIAGIVGPLGGGGGGDGGLVFMTATGNTVYERMRIIDTGKVGIQTTGPAETLDVSGTFKVSGMDLVASGGTITTSGNDKIHTFTTSSTLNVTGSGNVQVLAIGGGGGGGMDISGGGGAGGYQYNSSYAVTTGAYTVTVGTGGAGEIASAASKGDDGIASVFGTITATGGGGGGSGGNRNGANGGSGGGGADNGGQGLGGTGSQGSNGGNAEADGTSGGGGGGGASAVGANASVNNGGNGGAGTSNSISGSAVTYAGGGGGSGRISTDVGGTGGSGGGGRGAGSAGVSVAGTANTGGGGGGGSGTGGQQTGANGGTGIVIIRYTPSNARMVVSATGVGIATAAYSARLEVKGNIFASGSITSNSLRSAKDNIVLVTPETKAKINQAANLLIDKISRWNWKVPQEYRYDKQIKLRSEFANIIFKTTREIYGVTKTIGYATDVDGVTYPIRIFEATEPVPIISTQSVEQVTKDIRSVTDGLYHIESNWIIKNVTKMADCITEIKIKSATDQFIQYEKERLNFQKEKKEVEQSKNITTPRFGVTLDDMLDLAKVNPALEPFLKSMIVYSDDGNQPRLGHGEAIQAILSLVLIQQDRINKLEARVTALEAR